MLKNTKYKDWDTLSVIFQSLWLILMEADEGV